jgi:hypothetical protein
MAPTPLTVLSPVPRWWGAWARLTWLVARLGGGLVQRPLRNLSFIHFAHWSLVARWPADPAVSPDEAADRTLVFLTNYDGSDIQYIDAFVRVVPFQIEALYGGARDFPGPFRFRPVARYIDRCSAPVDHFWAAHPEATTTMIGQALELRGRFAAFEKRVAGASDAHFAHAWAELMSDVQGLV